MTTTQVRDAVGIFLISIHFLSVICLLAAFFLGGFSFPELTTALGVVAPIFAGYAAVIIKYFLAHKSPARRISAEREVRGTFLFVSFLLPALFGLFILALILLWACGIGFETFEQFKVLLAFGEVLFGAYLSQVIKALFGENREKTDREKEPECQPSS